MQSTGQTPRPTQAWPPPAVTPLAPLCMPAVLPPGGNRVPPWRDVRHIPDAPNAQIPAQCPRTAAWHASCCISARFPQRRFSDMPFNLNAYLGIQPDALQVFAQRANVLAANLANADTPGYKARDIDFRAALAAAEPQTPTGNTAAPGNVQMLTTNPLDVTATSAAGTVSTAQFLKYRIPLAPSIDGNTVSSQLEEAKFAQNTVRYQAALNFLEQRFRDLNTAITGQ